MFILLLCTFLIASGGDAQISEEGCDTNQLKICTDKIPHTPVGLPTTREELDAHCLAYQTGMTCMDAWIKRCLPTDGQKLVQKQIGGARAIMRFLCSNDTAFRKDYLRESKCWALVSPDWTRCADELQLAVHDISEQSHHIVYFNKNTELCCARDAFMLCVSVAGRACSSSAAHLLRRMAWVLAQDVAACSTQRAHCGATLPHLAVSALATLSSATALLYTCSL